MTIYFYKVYNPYGCFSNFSPHGIHLDGKDWQTVEHYYQAQKFKGTADEWVMREIWQAPTPEEAARLGRDSCRTYREDWSEAKTTVMRRAVFTKFLTHGEIQAVLLGTGDEEIVEDSPRDDFWGCGADRTGQNHLGKILMSVRDEIRQMRRVDRP
ncbi:MAG TPA: NADAR family protein [Oscillatoriales cyanobacterium M59_W2019_021]|nr:NADAR family protein [Oscillatoriales cyanobacterium M4454_W2019_049]HIK52027.1 NADAR family protein [Oscillatoriales cyanobacterium M59_W2019_021]